MFETDCTRCGNRITDSASLTKLTALYYRSTGRDFAEHTLCDSCRNNFTLWFNQMSGEDASAAGAASGTAGRIRRLREKNGYSLSDLAKESGVSRSYLYQIESGASEPTVSKARALAVALGVPLAELVGA